MKHKNQFYILIAVTFLFIVGIIAFAFAYIGRPTVSGNSQISANITASGVTFGYSGSSSLALSIDPANLKKASANNNGSNYVESSASTTTVTLTTSANTYASGTKCYYNVLYTPTSAYTPSSGATTNSLKELAIHGTNSNGLFTFDTSISGSSPVYLYQNAYIATASANSTVNNTWTFTMRFYNLNVNQESAIGQSPSGIISIETGKCEANS